MASLLAATTEKSDVKKEGAVQKTEEEAAAETGWCKVPMDSGHHYWWHKPTNKTQWTKPDAVAAAERAGGAARPNGAAKPAAAAKKEPAAAAKPSSLLADYGDADADETTSPTAAEAAGQRRLLLASPEPSEPGAAAKAGGGLLSGYDEPEASEEDLLDGLFRDIKTIRRLCAAAEANGATPAEQVHDVPGAMPVAKPLVEAPALVALFTELQGVLQAIPADLEGWRIVAEAEARTRVSDAQAGELRVAYAEQKVREMIAMVREMRVPEREAAAAGAAVGAAVLTAARKRKATKAEEGMMARWKDPEAAKEAEAEAKRDAELDAWAKEQEASGAAEDNPNFAPIQGDWRKRLKMRNGDGEE